jgi:FdhD protein
VIGITASGLAATAGGALRETTIVRFDGGVVADRSDCLVVEEPLEIRVQGADSEPRTVSVQMRTPGHDHELAVGLLHSERILAASADLVRVGHCDTAGTAVLVTLRGHLAPVPARQLVASSACGVCGKDSIESVLATLPTRIADSGPDLDGHGLAGRTTPGNRPQMSLERLLGLPAALRAQQQLFQRTGGLHAAALFSPSGTLRLLREDVGRHNAVDKLIGRRVLEGAMPLDNDVILFSGRVGFELVQKAAVAGIRFMAAVGAPSSLAVELAAEMDMTLVGFLQADRCNVYCGRQRVVGLGAGTQ